MSTNGLLFKSASTIKIQPLVKQTSLSHQNVTCSHDLAENLLELNKTTFTQSLAIHQTLIPFMLNLIIFIDYIFQSKHKIYK